MPEMYRSNDLLNFAQYYKVQNSDNATALKCGLATSSMKFTVYATTNKLLCRPKVTASCYSNGSSIPHRYGAQMKKNVPLTKIKKHTKRFFTSLPCRDAPAAYY